MSVPVDVPVNVPAGAAAPAKRKRSRVSGKGNDDSVPFLTRSGDGWRFQLRVPAALTEDFRLAGLAPIVRASLGPRGRGEARRLARQLATVCDTVFALAAARKDANTMTTMTPQEEDLATQVISTCQAAISRALKQPSQAIGLARGLDAALTSLRLVQTEVDKGTAGARAVVDHADALTRHALTDVLKLSASGSGRCRASPPRCRLSASDPSSGWSSRLEDQAGVQPHGGCHRPRPRPQHELSSPSNNLLP